MRLRAPGRVQRQRPQVQLRLGHLGEPRAEVCGEVPSQADDGAIAVLPRVAGPIRRPGEDGVLHKDQTLSPLQSRPCGVRDHVVRHRDEADPHDARTEDHSGRPLQRRLVLRKGDVLQVQRTL